MHAKPPQGFTLIEMLVLIVIFSGSLAALLSVSLEAARRIADIDASARATQYAQEGIERVLADRRNPNRAYAYIPIQSAACATLSVSCAYPTDNPITGTSLVRSVEIIDVSTSSSCPNATAGCKHVLVVVTQNGRKLASMAALLANE
jgi:prepilin-type N-terminal cleavage/methylation domain-containing protein